MSQESKPINLGTYRIVRFPSGERIFLIDGEGILIDPNELLRGFTSQWVTIIIQASPKDVAA